MTGLVIFLIAVALAFDFLNGLHDAANSIATIVSTRVLSPRHAVAWAAFVPVTKVMGRAFDGRDGLTLGLWASSLLLLPFAAVEGTMLHADAVSVGGPLITAAPYFSNVVFWATVM